MILHLAERLEIPMRERNVLLLAAGYAPIFAERAYAIRRLRQHERRSISFSSGSCPIQHSALTGIGKSRPATVR